MLGGSALKLFAGIAILDGFDFPGGSDQRMLPAANRSAGTAVEAPCPTNFVENEGELPPATAGAALALGGAAEAGACVPPPLDATPECPPPPPLECPPPPPEWPPPPPPPPPPPCCAKAGCGASASAAANAKPRSDFMCPPSKSLGRSKGNLLRIRFYSMRRSRAAFGCEGGQEELTLDSSTFDC
jgi:hypothetical protein